MNDAVERQYIASIPRFGEIKQILPILKGYSLDKKFLVETAAASYIVKVFAEADYEAKQAEYEALQAMRRFQVKCTQAYELGRWEQLGKGYLVLNYIDGESGEEALPHYTAEQQYQIGLDAGRELLKIHQYSSNSSIQSWYERKAAKHSAYMNRYASLGISIPHDERIIAYIDQHLELMRHRPNSFQHDDFHPSNLIVKNGALSGVIDFNRCDWGDPFHEFIKVGMFSVDVSKPFSIGQIKGYFNGQEPSQSFWQLYTLYIAMCLISSIVWINKVKPEETPQMMERMIKVMEDHQYFESIVPSWYS